MKTSKKVPKKPGVYLILNTKNNDFYIGSSNCLYKRFHAHKSYCKKSDQRAFKSMKILRNAYLKYNPDDFEFIVIKESEDYRKWEQLFINLLKPKYNICSMINGQNRPNLGKKFNKEWIDKLGRCKGHTKSTRNKLTKLNKEGRTVITIKVNGTVETYHGYKELADRYKISRRAAVNRVKRGYSDWDILKVEKNQKKKVLLKMKNKTIKTFNSSYQCDKYLDLWRGATSNAIRNYQGQLHDYIVEYV